MLKLIRRLALALLCVTTPALAAQGYIEVKPAHATAVKKGEIELIEFFWFGCIHCYSVVGSVNKLEARLPKNVRFTRMPAVFNDRLAILARGYYTLEELPNSKQLGEALFETIHAWGQRVETEQDFIDWAAKSANVDRKKIADIYYSARVASKVAHARQLTADYRLDNVPMFVINGKYVTDLVIAGDEAALFDTINKLIARERR